MPPEKKPKPVQEKVQERIDLEEKEKPSFLTRFRPLLFTLGLFIIVTVLILMLSVLKMANQKFKMSKTFPTPTSLPQPIQPEEDRLIFELEQQGTSDEITAIEADLETTDFTGLDKELEEIETELTTP